MPYISIESKIGNISLSSCIYNASGAKCASEEDLDNLNRSKSGAIMAKSCTENPRLGNPKPRYAEVALGSINSMGLPNGGLQYYLDYAKSKNSEFTKPFFLSVAGLSLEENLRLLKKIKNHSFISAVELNLSCPNLPGKPQTGYDINRTKEILNRIFDFYDLPLGVKLPPYFDIIHFEQMAEILNNFPLSFVTCINSIGNGLIIDPESERVLIKPKNGFGGIGGDFVKPTALANVRKFYELLTKVDVIGCGGISSGLDVFEHILCGASAVQIGTLLMREGVKCFSRLEHELKQILAKKGYSKLSKFRGNLKT